MDAVESATTQLDCDAFSLEHHYPLKVSVWSNWAELKLKKTARRLTFRWRHYTIPPPKAERRRLGLLAAHHYLLATCY